jgi:hypothetical protein
MARHGVANGPKFGPGGHIFTRLYPGPIILRIFESEPPGSWL